ncbi:hypothetical protein BGZ65_008932 [Modicella reniformis]|uniref:Uncharacterized protein n=1 Tax=Modicella reniformis TaxID=1440133 RepID=A0A9P6II63_9FUNG|nr:hypothetical protein BGZ65_008932 [Modicella reniformis]
MQIRNPPCHLVRSVASQLAVELKKHYKECYKALRLKIMKRQKQQAVPLDSLTDVPTIEMFMYLNHLASKWKLIPLSPMENGQMSFSERELGAFFQKNETLREEMRSFIQWQSQH